MSLRWHKHDNFFNVGQKNRGDKGFGQPASANFPPLKPPHYIAALHSSSSVDSAVDVANEPTPPSSATFTAPKPPRVINSIQYGAGNSPSQVCIAVWALEER